MASMYKLDAVSAGLLAALNPSRSVESEALLASLTSDQWQALADLAIRQGVAPQIPVHDLAHLPEAAAARLKERAELSATIVAGYSADFLSLAAAVADRNLPIVALKGIHLALSVYPPSVTREMGDIDILVRRDDVEAVHAAANKLGYCHDPEILDRTPNHLPPLIKTGGKTPGLLEIHWQLAEPGTPPDAAPDQLWSRIRSLPMAPNAFTLAPEHALIHICAHAAYSHHFEQGVRPLCDIRALIDASGHGMDWGEVASRAIEWRSDRGVVLGLVLARNLLGASFPKDVIPRLGGDPPSSIVAAAVDQVFAVRIATHAVSGNAGQLLAGTPWQRFRRALRSLSVPKEQVESLYPGRSGRSPLILATVTVRRAADLLKRYSSVLLRTAFSPQSPEARHIVRRNELRDWLGLGG
jgi:hypothetical protein